MDPWIDLGEGRDPEQRDIAPHKSCSIQGYFGRMKTLPPFLMFIANKLI